MEAVTTELPKRRRVLRDDVPLTPAQIELRERMEAEVARRKAGRQARQEPTRDESAPTRQSVPPRSYTSSSLLKPPTHSRTRSRNRVLKGMTVSALAVAGVTVPVLGNFGGGAQASQPMAASILGGETQQAQTPDSLAFHKMRSATHLER